MAKFNLLLQPMLGLGQAGAAVSACVNMQNFAGNARGQFREQKAGGGGYFALLDVPAQRGNTGYRIEHVAEIADAARGKGFDGSCGNGVHSYALRAETSGKVAHRTFQCRLGHAHHIVVGDRELGAKVGQGQDRRTGIHQRGRTRRESGQRVGADVQCLGKLGPAGYGVIIPFQSGAVGIGD